MSACPAGATVPPTCCRGPAGRSRPLAALDTTHRPQHDHGNPRACRYRARQYRARRLLTSARTWRRTSHRRPGGSPRDGVRVLVSQVRTPARSAITGSPNCPGSCFPATCWWSTSRRRCRPPWPFCRLIPVFARGPFLHPAGRMAARARRAAPGAKGRRRSGTAADYPAQGSPCPAGAVLKLGTRVTGRLWRVRLSTAVPPYLLRHGTAIRYSFVDQALAHRGVPNGIRFPAGQRRDAQREPAVHGGDGDPAGGGRDHFRALDPAHRGV